MPPIISSLIPFQEDFIPPSIVNREVERLELNRFMEPLTRNEPQLYNLLVTGTIGVGKTVLTRFITRELPSMSFYIRLTEADDAFSKILFKIITIMGLPISPYTSSNLALLRFIQYFNERKVATLLVLDDFDKAPINAVRCILHEISRGTNYCNLLIISRIPSALEELPPDTKSTLRCHELPLKTYDREHLFQILKQRANLALKQGSYSDDILEEVAKTAELSGSAREAIEILKISAVIAQSLNCDKIKHEHIEYAIAEIERRSLEETIRDLPIYHKLILQLCTPNMQSYEEVYRKWRHKLELMNLHPLSIYRFRDFVADLKKLDLVRPEIKGKGRGKGFSYYLYLSPNIVKIMEKLKLSSQ
jgi:cell division control protein 6